MADRMEISRAHFALTLPDGIVERATTVDEWRADGGGLALAIETRMESASASVEQMLNARTAGLPFVSAREGDLHLRTLLLDDDEEPRVLSAFVTHEVPLLGERCLVSFRVEQTEDGSAEELEARARAILATLKLLPARAAIERGEAVAAIIDPTQIYPCPVTRELLEGRPADAPVPPTIGHGIHLAIAARHPGRWRINFPEDMFEMRASVLALAAENLAVAVQRQELAFQTALGPRDLPFLVIGPEDWLASSCLFLPGLEELARDELGAGPFLASIPYRGVMIVFRREDAAYRAAMRALIAEAEADNPSAPLTDGLFLLTPAGCEPFDEP